MLRESFKKINNRALQSQRVEVERKAFGFQLLLNGYHSSDLFLVCDSAYGERIPRVMHRNAPSRITSYKQYKFRANPVQ